MKSIFRTFLYGALFLLIVSYAFIEGFRMPNLWSINYYIPGFFDGFYRRSLVGTLLGFLGEYRFHYYVIASIQFAVLISLLFWIFRIFQTNGATVLLISTFFVSACGGFFFHEVGYIEQLLYLILFVSIVTYKRYRVWSIILFSSSMFIHELTLFVTVPLYALAVYLQTNRLKEVVASLIPALAMFALIYFFFQTVPWEEVQHFTAQIKAYADYSYRYDYYIVFVNEFTGERNKIYYDLNSITPLLLLMMMTLILSLSAYHIKRDKLTAVLIALSGIAPLFLGWFGYDLNRWYFLSFSSLTIAFILFILRYEVTFANLMGQKWGAALAVGCVLFAGNMQIGYFEWQKPRDVNMHALSEIGEIMFKIPKL